MSAATLTRAPVVPLDGVTRADALFVSPLQPSAAPTAVETVEAITVAVYRFGTRGCAGRVAEAYGRDPAGAAARMRWALGILPDVSTVEVARRALILTPANSLEKDARWADLHRAVMGSPPPGSTPLAQVTA